MLFPIFSRLRAQNIALTVNLVITVKKIFDVYRKDPFYQAAAEMLGIKVEFVQMSNKFDVPKRHGF